MVLTSIKWLPFSKLQQGGQLSTGSTECTDMGPKSLDRIFLCFVACLLFYKCTSEICALRVNPLYCNKQPPGCYSEVYKLIEMYSIVNSPIFIKMTEGNKRRLAKTQLSCTTT